MILEILNNSSYSIETVERKHEEFVSALKADMSLYNSMVHKAYKYLSDRYKGFNTYKDSEIEQILKKEYNTNDYFPLSTLWLAKSYLKRSKNLVINWFLEESSVAGSPGLNFS